MSAPVSGGRRRSPLLPVAIATAIVLVTLLAVLAPRPTPSGTSLASDSASPIGALGLFLTLGRLGWHPVRQEAPLVRARGSAPATNAVYVAVRADHGVDERTAGDVLAAVRNGAGLVVDVRPNDPLSDSLGLVLTNRFTSRPVDNTAVAAALDASAALRQPGCRPDMATDVGSGTRYVSFALADSGAAAASRPGRRVLLDVAATRAGREADPRAGAQASPQAGRDPVVVGFPYGRGRVVAIADASLLTNAALRTCWAAAGVVAVRAFEWVSADVPQTATRPRVLFFEGARDPEQVAARAPSVIRAVRRALTEVPAGRAVTQLIAAALVLLAAAAGRALPPVPAPRVARRSLLEHVGALARAYREVRASRVAARRLASGLRRRYGGPFAAGAAVDATHAASDLDVRFLATVAARFPARGADVARLTTALTEPASPADVVAMGEAAARIARTLDAARRGAEIPA